MAERLLAYLDSNFFINAMEGVPELLEPSQRLLKALRDRPGYALTSDLTLAETLAPSRTGRKRPPDLQRQYLNLLLHSGIVEMYPVSRGILLETVKLRSTRATGKLRIPDAIHLATAIANECALFVSADAGIPLPSGMQRVTADDRSMTRAIEVLS